MKRSGVVMLETSAMVVILSLGWYFIKPLEGTQDEIASALKNRGDAVLNLVGGGCRKCTECCFDSTLYYCTGNAACNNAMLTYYQCNTDTNNDLYACYVMQDICNAQNKGCNMATECFCTGP